MDNEEEKFTFCKNIDLIFDNGNIDTVVSIACEHRI